MRERVLATVCACKWHAAHWVLSKSHWQWEQSVDKPEKYSSVAGSFSDQCSARHGFRQRIWSAKQGTAQMQLFNTHIATSKSDSTCRTSSQSLSTARRKKKTLLINTTAYRRNFDRFPATTHYMHRILCILATVYRLVLRALLAMRTITTTMWCQ